MMGRQIGRKRGKDVGGREGEVNRGQKRKKWDEKQEEGRVLGRPLQFQGFDLVVNIL